MRGFASTELGLPDNARYTRYTDLGRPFVLWNVFAAPSLSLTPLQWCFPVAGCVNYRGYFREDEARAEAARLRALGDDVHVAGVPAYSTLGWFDPAAIARLAEDHRRGRSDHGRLLWQLLMLERSLRRLTGSAAAPSSAPPQNRVRLAAR